MFAKIQIIFVSILLIFWCVYLRDGKCAQLSYNFLWISCHYMNDPWYIYIYILYLYWYLLWSVIYSYTYSFCLSRKYYTQYIVFSSQHFPIFFLSFVYIFLYFPYIFEKFSYFFSYIFQYKPWKACWYFQNTFL